MLCNYKNTVFIRNVIPVLLAVILLFTSNLYAGSKIPKVRHSLKPLDLSRVPTTKELMAAGQLGGQLYPTKDIKLQTNTGSMQDTVSNRNKEINLSFGRAIQEWNRHEYKKAVKMFRKHAGDYPDSPWVDEALLHIGCDARYNGRYTEAEGQYKRIIENNKGKAYEGAKRLTNKARLRLGVLKVLQNNNQEATKFFAELKKESLSWRERTYASHWIQRISRYKGQGLARLKCGTEALAYLMEKEGLKVEAGEVAEIVPETENGHSISDIVDIASGYGHKLVAVQLSASELKDIVLPAIMQITPKNAGDKGHYWVLDKIEKEGIELYDPQSRRRFHQSLEEFSKEWTGNALVSSSDSDVALPGIMLSASKLDEYSGGCCGEPTPEDDLGDPEENANEDNEGQCSEGSPIWKVNMVNMNLFVTDTPMWYASPIGPSVRIRLSYNSKSAIVQNEPFGNKWVLNYSSYLIEDTGGEITIFMPDGRRDIFTPNGQGGYAKPLGVFNSLIKIAENHFELKFPGGAVYIYDIPSGTGSLQPFMVEMRDAYGQSLTFGYNSNVELETITDATGKITTFVDNNSDGLIDQVNDPFGRSAYFQYDANSNLTRITDMGGYWTDFTYDQDVYLTSMENEKSRWDFYIEPADGIENDANPYPAPGDDMWEDYRITITDPAGMKEQYNYNGDAGDQSWYVSSRDYIPYTASNNNFINASKKYYYFDNIDEKGKIRKKEYLEGGYLDFTYDTLTGRPATVTDYHGHKKHYTYNGNGRIKSFEDAKGNTTKYVYYPNNIDVQEVRYDLGATPENDNIILNTFSYNGNTHDITSLTDRLGNITELSYNSSGQITGITNAKGTPIEITTEMVYNSVTHELSEIRKNGNTVASYTYDSIGRTRTFTNSKDYTVTYWEYNDLDQPTKITFPDTLFNAGVPESKFVNISYSSCCPRMIDSITDRAGLTTSYIYDGLKRLTAIQAPRGVIQYKYDANGNLTQLIESDGRTTFFDYDLDNRLVKKMYPDGRFIQYEYDPAGLVAKITNSRGIETNYTDYDENHNLLTVDYSDATPDVAYTYDNYNRLQTMTDGLGIHTYGYDNIDRLVSIDGPWIDDTVIYQYNGLGHLKNLLPQGGQAITYNYDYDAGYSDSDIGRLKDIQAGPNTFTYSYSGVSPLVENITRPNGSVTEYLYNDPLKRLSEINNKDSAQTVISRHLFTYSNLDVIDTENITTGTPLSSFTEGMKTYDYNNLNQLLSSTGPAELFDYDDDGNMTQGYTPAGHQFTAAYDAENRLTSIAYNDGANDYETRYFYSGDGFLARLEKWDDTVLQGTLNKTDEIRFIRSGSLVIQERNDSNAITREYTWGLDMGGGIGGLLNLNQGGQDYNYLYDGKGNVMALLDSSQAVAASYRYDTFGNLKVKTGIIDQPFMFSTKKYDEQTGLSYYGYRFYNPAIGKWINRDPLGEAGGINLYGFVGNNPVNFVDPWGLETIVVHKGSKQIEILDDNGKSIYKESAVVGCPRYDTPEGEFQAGDWVKDKTNSKYGPKPWSEDKTNPYGPWFLPIHNKDDQYTTYGIHGTAGPGWSPFVEPPLAEIWSSPDDFLTCSHGCVRQSNPDIKKMHKLLPNPKGTTIIIKK